MTAHLTAHLTAGMAAGVSAGLGVERVGGVGSGDGAGLVDYLTAWALQRAVHADVAAGRRRDTLLLLEHPPVYTAGKLTQPADLPADGTPVVDVDRGGRITWHGPGQLVGYPVLRLPGRLDVVRHVRRVEELLITVCADLGVAARRVKGRSGVWVAADGWRPERKVAAIGIRVAQGTTMHGFALNCDNDLAAYAAIVPCGIPDAGVTTLAAELGRHVTVAEVLPVVERHAQLLDPAREPDGVVDHGPGGVDHGLRGAAPGPMPPEVHDRRTGSP